MKINIAILGSTGSIGKSTLEVIKKDKRNFEIVFLSANNNYRKLVRQAKEFDVKNVLIKNKIGLKKIPPPMPTIPDTKPKTTPIEDEI